MTIYRASSLMRGTWIEIPEERKQKLQKEVVPHARDVD